MTHLLEEKKFRPAKQLNGKDLLSIETLTQSEIALILNTAAALKFGKAKMALKGETAALLFYEPSTRTRVSFEIAAQHLGMTTVSMDVPTSSVQKGESLTDTGKTLEAMGVRFLIVRHTDNGGLESLAKTVRSHVINAGDGSREHPTQALLDLFTLHQKKKRLQGLKVVILGDILYSRVARSDAWALTKMGSNVTVCGPENLLPKDEMRNMGVTVTSVPEEAVEEADAIIALRLQRERHADLYIPSLSGYFERYGLTRNLLRHAKRDCLVMHPGPMNRNVEITDEVADGAQSAVLDQVANGVWVRMAVLCLLSKT